jgi:CheY-like chemotaxis protein
MPLALIVDDSMLVRHTVCRYMEERGFKVESAASGDEALEFLQRTHPDIVLAASQMPGLDSDMLIARLRSDPHTLRVPVVLLSGPRAESRDDQRFADFVIHKNLELEQQLRQALMVTMGVGRA